MAAAFQYTEQLLSEPNGGTKTLRSKLQDRKVTLSEAIEKENLFLKGSERLAGISGDQKTRDQAALQKDFAESKIKTLQAELTKINSSLHAYQAESARGVQVPIIPITMKTTAAVDMTEALETIITSHYHTDPATMKESIKEFNKLRSCLERVERSEAGVQALLQYYKQLVLVSRRMLHPKLKPNVLFVWYDAINGLPTTQQSSVFERACILFNIAALYTQLAAKVNRSSTEALDSAIGLLEKAIGMFEYTKVKFSHSPMRDMSSEILTLISDLMKAQAQEMAWEKDLLAGLEEDGRLVSLLDCSHKTKSVAECFRPIRDKTEEEQIKEYLPDTWIALIKIKESHYKGLAHYYAARVHQELATIYEQGRHVPEDICTEIRFLYSDYTQEVVSTDPKIHIGIGKSHINCAALSHEYALKFCNLCRDLHHISRLTQMLAEAEADTQQLKEELVAMEGAKVIAPTILACETSVSVKMPAIVLPERHEDLFAGLGPLPAFSGSNLWSPPRTILLLRIRGTFGIFVRGAQPVVVTGVDPKGSAERAGIKVKDWVLAVNSTDVRYKSHDEVVAMVMECKEEVTLEVTTPSPSESSSPPPEDSLYRPPKT